MNQRMVNEHAWALARSVMETIESTFGSVEDERVFHEMYLCIRNGLEAYEISVARMQQRLHPLANQEVS